MKNSRSATAPWIKGFRSFLNLLYPRCCPLCHEILADQNSLICPECAEKIRPIMGATCCKCGKTVKKEEEYCRDCRKYSGAFTQGRGIFLYDKQMKDSLMKYKYSGRREYGRFYGKAMYVYAKKELYRWHPDLLIPVPLYWKKQRMRGFNQAEYLAEQLSSHAGIPVGYDLVKKIKSTKSQKKLNAADRRKNLRAAFQVTGNVKGRKILLIDDVYTTGSTMDALASVLLAAGAREVYFLTLCIGRGED